DGRMLGQVDRAHAALTDLFLYYIITDGGPDQGAPSRGSLLATPDARYADRPQRLAGADQRRGENGHDGDGGDGGGEDDFDGGTAHALDYGRGRSIFPPRSSAVEGCAHSPEKLFQIGHLGIQVRSVRDRRRLARLKRGDAQAAAP